MGNNLIYMRRRLGIMAQPHRESKTGDLVTFTGIKAPLSVLAQINPVQSLNGQANPYPPGGGKNKLDSRIIATSKYIRGSDGAVISSSDWCCSETYSEILPSTDYAIIKTSNSSSVAGFALYDSDKQYISGESYGNSTRYPLTTPSNAKYIRVSWRNTAPNPTMVILATETDKTFAPYSNICPISGWTGCEVTRTGKNLWNPNATVEEWIGPTDSKPVTRTGTASMRFACSEGDKIAVSMQNASSNTNVMCVATLDSNGNKLTRTVKNTGATSMDVTAGTGATQLFVAFFAESETGWVQVERDTTISTTYEPYQGTTLSVTWTSAGTVYGGSLAINTDGTGVLTETWESVDMGSLSWEKQVLTGGYYFKASVEGIKEYSSARTQPLVCSSYRNISDGSAYSTELNYCIYNAIVSGQYKICVIDKSYENASNFTTGVTGQKILYELATPVTYNLSAEQVGQLMALNGMNNVWANTGEISVEYWKH